MKKYYSIILLLSTAFSFAQIPSNYYDSANGLSGYALKTQLRDIVTTGHNDQGYNALWTAYATTDIDNTNQYDNDGFILDIYTEDPSAPEATYLNFTYITEQCGNYSTEGDCYNREHLVPQSSFDEASPMVNDVHHIYPTDGKVNGMRSNYPLATVSSDTYTSPNGSKLGNSSVAGYSGTVFEPIDEFKGDVARALLYFAVRYQDNVDTYTSFDMFNGSENQVFETWALNMLLDWHNNVDPVSQKELDRNEAAYDFQGNANPFVDHPEYANMIWNQSPDTQAPDAITDLQALNPTDNSIDLTWTEPFDNVGVSSYDIYMVGNPNPYNTSNTYFPVPGLTSDTNYCFTVYANDAAGNTSMVSNQVCEMTTNNGSSGGTDCITEDFENIPANDGSYSTRTWSGTNGNWTATDARTDQTLNGRAITIRNGDLTSPTVTGGNGELTVTTQLVFSGSSGTFDVKVNGSSIGTIPYSSTVQTTTIPNINTEGTITVVFDSNSSGSNRVRFDDLSWTCYSTLSLEEDNISNTKFYPNPLKGNKLYIDTNQTLNIEIFNILGKRLITDEVNSNKNYLNLSNLNSGIYLIKISNNNKTITKKLIKQ